MPISSALQYARVSSASGTGTGLYRPARVGAIRLGYFGPKLLLQVAGTNRHRNFDRNTWSITTDNGQYSATLDFEVFGFTPANGQEVTLGAGSLGNRLFRGVIVRVKRNPVKLNEGRPVYRVRCLAWAHLLQGVLITKRYVGLSASTIFADLMTFAPVGFSASHVQASLPAIDEITFTMTPLPMALQQTIERIGGYQYVDFEKALWAYTSVGEILPETITSSNRHVRQLTYDTDVEELRNRILVEGKGATTTSEVLAGFSTIPLTETEAFADSGTNYAKLNDQVIAYTGKSSVAGQGSTVSGIPQGPSAPSAAAVGGTVSGGVIGAVSYKVLNCKSSATSDQADDSETSAASNTVTISAVAAPGSPPSVSVSTTQSGKIPVGTFRYKVTFGTSLGETLPSSASSGFAVPAVSAPGSATASTLSAPSGKVDIGAHDYKVTYLTSEGETALPVSTASITVSTLVAPSGVPTTTGTTGGSLTTLTQYYYRITFVTAEGETLQGSSETSHTLAGANNAIQLTNIATSGDARVTKRRIYRRTGGGGGPFYLVTTINDNSTTSYTDTTADTSLGAMQPTTDTSGGVQVALTSIPTSSDGRVLRRKIYRTKANIGTTYYYLTTLPDNSTTSYTDNTADANLGDVAENLDTSGGGRINLSSIPTSASARVTKRVIYRTKANGSVYFKLTSLGDNSTTSYADNVSDDNLIEPAPIVDESGGGKVTVTVPVGPTGIVRRKLFRTTAGGSVYKYCGTISDNSTTTYTDTKLDEDLGDDDPQESKVRTLAGSTTLPVKDLSQFPASGWARVGSQVISYTGRAASSGVGNLTGIPASGAGSLQKFATHGTEITVEPHLTGVSSLVRALSPGDPLNILVIREDGTSQATWGVRSKHVVDRSATLQGCQDLAEAMLTLLKDPRVSGSLRSTDLKLRPGKPLVINVTEWGFSATVTVQRATIGPGTDAAGTPWTQPMVDAQFASRSIEDINTMLRVVREQLVRTT